EFHASSFLQNDQANPSVASSGTGSFVVVWDSVDQQLGYGISVRGQRYSASGAALGSEFHVDSAPLSAAHPAVSSDSAGNYVVVWQYELLGTAVYGQRFSSAGTPLGSNFEVISAPPASFTAVSEPSVASSSSGFL